MGAEGQLARPGSVIAGLSARRSVRSGALWGLVFGGYVATSALGYVATYPHLAARRALAATFGSNTAIAALIGVAHSIETVPGFTAWRSLGVLSVLGAVWGLLMGTRILRGEEESGRLELLLSGVTDRKRAALGALGGLTAGIAALVVVSGVIVVAVGHSAKVQIAPGPCTFLVLSLASSAAFFSFVGTLAGELAATRHQASTYGGMVLGAAFVARMVADSGTGLGWLRWATPLGWVEELQPLEGDHAGAFVPLAVGCLVLAVSTVVLAARRDFGSSLLTDASSAPARTGLLGGPFGLAIRVTRFSLTAWGCAIVLVATLTGLLAKDAGEALADSARASSVLRRLGDVGLGAESYLGVAFLILEVLLALVAASQVGAVRAEESSTRVEHLLVAAVSRTRWYASRVVPVTVVIVCCGAASGLGAWCGTALQHDGLGPWTLAEAGLNVVAPALFLLGLGAFSFGVAPRLATAVVYGALAWSFLVELLGSLVISNHWLLDSSLFHQVAGAPAVSPAWSAFGVLIALGAVGSVLGAAGFARRDLAGE